MKLTQLIILFLLLGFLTTCTIKEQIKQRHLLKKTKIDLINIVPTIDFDANFIDIGGKNTKLQNIKFNDLSVLNDLQQGKFSLKLSGFKLNNTFQIKNQNKQSVMLDKFTFDIFFDKQKITTITNHKTIKVAANNHQDFLITTAINRNLKLGKLLGVKYIRIKGVFTLSLVFLGKTFDFDVNFDKKKLISHKLIKQSIGAAKQKIINDIRKKIKNNSAQQLEKLHISF